MFLWKWNFFFPQKKIPNQFGNLKKPYWVLITLQKYMYWKNVPKAIFLNALLNVFLINKMFKVLSFFILKKNYTPYIKLNPIIKELFCIFIKWIRSFSFNENLNALSYKNNITRLHLKRVFVLQSSCVNIFHFKTLF